MAAKDDDSMTIGSLFCSNVLSRAGNVIGL
jgi:hypothetical protein